MSLDELNPMSGLSEQLKGRYESNSTATDLSVRIGHPKSASGSLKGLLRIPGWIRERAAEVFFENGDEDEPSLVEVILSMLKEVRRAISCLLAFS